ncbi:trypsin-like serine peptidase [Actinospica robiniae]|uniref:trypsin-like serine peptidase n=1 Tax=Actinospica robiniae TaxID=304901 RepID=UPI000425A5BD|nr:trypsin-like peptidase domain-containing protein [Actinospica robiniae]
MPLIPLLSAKILAPVVAASALTAAATARTTTAGTLPPDLPAPPALVSATSLSSPRAGAAFAGLPQVGALVWQNLDGTPGKRLCSAVAVDSPNGDLIATAAHCVAGVRATVGGPMAVAYLPGWDGSSTPYGVWYPTRVIRAKQWSASKGGNPDFDISFLTVFRKDDPRPLETVTGAERFGAIPAPGTLTVQLGYADDGQAPLVCRSTMGFHSRTQLRVVCDGFPAGTSGGPLLTNVDPSTGIGTLVGVVGGYQQGGAGPAISYAAAFTPAIQSLYREASRY